MIPYVLPEFKKPGFNCPQPDCQVYAKQKWHSGGYGVPSYQHVAFGELEDLDITICDHCGKYSIWRLGKMIYPENTGIVPPNPDVNDSIQQDYLEARSIVNKSPRGAAALLRLCVQKLCVQLGEVGEKIDIDIANLVRKGLPTRIQQSLDIVRVIGNNAVHPGELDLKDDRDIAVKLFELINLIAESMITQPKNIGNLYNSLPEESRKHIEKRDRA